jgi:hypothetical protein
MREMGREIAMRIRKTKELALAMEQLETLTPAELTEVSGGHHKPSHKHSHGHSHGRRHGREHGRHHERKHGHKH